MFGLANAQTVQNIPNETPLELEGTYSVITVKTLPEDGSDPKPRTKQDADGVQQFDNMCDGDIAVLKLNNTQEACYVINFETGTKNNGSSVLFELINASGDTEWSSEVEIANNAQWNKFIPCQAFVEDPLPTGEYSFRLTFLNEAGGTTNVANLRKFIFEARPDITTSSLYTTVEPGDDAGKIVLSPAQNTYLNGTEITMTAQPVTGYTFVKWDINGEEYTENPYTLVISETTDVTAYFEELKMDSDIPGFVNLETRTSGQGKLESKTGVQLDGEALEGAQNNLGDYRNGQGDVFALNVTETGSYIFYAAASTKMNYDNYPDADPKVDFTVYDAAAYEADPATAEPEWTYTLEMKGYALNNWSKYTSYSVPAVNLTKGAKQLVLKFREETGEKKYTVNLLKFGFGLTPDWWVDNSSVADVAADSNVVVKAYNLQGIEVARDTKGLLILSNGTKVYNK